MSSWRTVRQALENAVPPERKTPVRVAPKLDPAKAWIDAMLVEDLSAPRKQQHSAGKGFARFNASGGGTHERRTIGIKAGKFVGKLFGKVVAVPATFIDYAAWNDSVNEKQSLLKDRENAVRELQAAGLLPQDYYLQGN